MTIRRYCSLLAATATMLTVSGAQAWDPNAGATPPAPAPYQRLPESVVPARYHVEPMRAMTAPAPVAIVQPAPAVVAPLPEPQQAPIAYQPVPAAPAVIEAPMRYVPVEQPTTMPPAAAVAYTPQPAITYAPAPVAPAPAVAYNPYPPIAYTPQPISYLPPISPDAHKTSSYASRDQFSLGVEAFYDRYEEPDEFPELGVDAYYGAIDGSWTHYYNPAWFGRLEGRASYGRADYSSRSGKIDGISDYEFDARYVAGYDFAHGTSHFKPYFGFGTRLYLDYFKQEAGDGSYDRRILQFYAPIGATYSWVSSGGLTYTPLVEIDPLLYGYVQSRLDSVGLAGFENTTNHQTSGMGYRAEFMVGRVDESGRGWQAGPFARYWDIDDSDAQGLVGVFEPRNTRWQVGAKLNYLF